MGGYLLHFFTEATQNPQIEVTDTVEKMRNVMEKLSESCSLYIISITPITVMDIIIGIITMMMKK